MKRELKRFSAPFCFVLSLNHGCLFFFRIIRKRSNPQKSVFMKLKAVFIGLVIVLAGCATPLTIAGKGIKVTQNPEEVSGCRYVQTITTIGHFAVGGVSESRLSATNLAKNKAAELGGNILFVRSMTTTPSLATTLTADVYSTSQ